MNRHETLKIVREFGKRWGVGPLDTLRVEVERMWLRAIAHRVYCDSPRWEGYACVERAQTEPTVFDFRPTDHRVPMLPPWAAYPSYSAMNIGWRMGTGEDYMGKWRLWYEAQSTEKKKHYQGQFPPPDDERGWSLWFYDLSDEADR